MVVGFLISKLVLFCDTQRTVAKWGRVPGTVSIASVKQEKKMLKHLERGMNL